MIKLSNTIDDCEFCKKPKGDKYLHFPDYCIRINRMLVMEIPKEDYGNYELLNKVFEKFIKYNYRPFWSDPIGHIFGRRKCYDWGKLNHQ